MNKINCVEIGKIDFEKVFVFNEGDKTTTERIDLRSIINVTYNGKEGQRILLDTYACGISSVEIYATNCGDNLVKLTRIEVYDGTETKLYMFVQIAE